MADLSSIIDETVRRERGRIIGGLLRICGNLDAAEEAFQESVLTAVDAWRDQIPANPGAWLMTAAKNRARDEQRHQAVVRTKAPLLVEDHMDALDTIDTVSDDYLRLIFTCCHPALSVDNQIALTLKVVAGFSTREIARAFVCSEATDLAADLAREADARGPRRPVHDPGARRARRARVRRARRRLRDLQRRPHRTTRRADAARSPGRGAAPGPTALRPRAARVRGVRRGRHDGVRCRRVPTHESTPTAYRSCWPLRIARPGIASSCAKGSWRSLVRARSEVMDRTCSKPRSRRFT